MPDTERLCWPAITADEIMPEGLATPAKWIAGRCEHGWLIGPKSRRERIELGCDIIQPGAEMLFMWCEPRGTAMVLVSGDGTCRAAEALPSDWTSVVDDAAIDIIADSLDDFARQCIDVYGIERGHGEYITARFLKWTEQRYRLEVINGAPAFIPLTPDPAQPLATTSPEGSA